MSQVESLPHGVLRAAAIYGANASGKTNVIRALSYMASAVVQSHRNWPPDGPIPVEPFALDGGSPAEPSLFAVDFVLSGVRHQYGFSIGREDVHEEWLRAYPKGKRQTWFHRVRGRRISFGKNLPGENRAIENLTRRNSLFLSAAAQNNHEALLPVYRWFSSNLSFVMQDRSVLAYHAAQMCSDEKLRSVLSNMIAAADVGITEMTVQEQEVPDQTKELLKAVQGIFKPETAPPIPERLRRISLLHQAKSGSVALPLEEESKGTQAFFAMLSQVLVVLSSGALLCVDELDASLHPYLAMEIVRLFNGKAQNPQGAQIIFNTQDTNLLQGDLLRRDQIWFTEKDEDGNSHLYPLTDFKPRLNENLQTGYLQGRYGAIPFVDSGTFLSCLEERHAKTR